jgi:hypothetical protein
MWTETDIQRLTLPYETRDCHGRLVLLTGDGRTITVHHLEHGPQTMSARQAADYLTAYQCVAPQVVS